MTKRCHSFEIELHLTQVFARIPYVGELFACRVHGVTFSPWRKVVEAEARLRR
jgi:hypothetical protein